GHVMITLGESTVRLCEGVTRREWLRVGGLAPLGLTLPGLLGEQARAEAPAGKAKSCIVLFLFGRPAHHDIWDPKPQAGEYWGEFRSVATSVPGTFVGEHIPLLAAQARQFTLVRSVTHPNNTHTVAMHYMLTGRRHARPQTNPRNEPTD